MKTAIVHDWLTSPGGAERVLEQILQLYPDADLFTICDLLEDSHRGFLHGKVPKTSFIQRLPFVKTHYRSYLPLMPLAIEQLDMSSYDLIISSSYAVAKGVITGPEQRHICYIHTPIRYAWHLQAQYLHESNLHRGTKSWVARAFLHYLRMWDVRSAVCVDAFVSNSEYVAKQVQRIYGRDCKVVPPPVNLKAFPFTETKGDFYMTASRLVPYKRVDLIVKAFARMPTRRLLVVGEGPEMCRIRDAARGKSNIEILGYQSQPELRSIMSESRGFVFAAIEDFGISPVEAQACGTPVIALGKAGILETVRGLDTEKPTGVLFSEQTEEAIIDAVHLFEREEARIKAIHCRENAEQFSEESFCSGLQKIITEQLRSLGELRDLEWSGAHRIANVPSYLGEEELPLDMREAARMVHAEC